MVMNLLVPPILGNFLVALRLVDSLERIFSVRLLVF
jgi:hypothetical protein